jgi:hypothetical protein
MQKAVRKIPSSVDPFSPNFPSGLRLYYLIIPMALSKGKAVFLYLPMDVQSESFLEPKQEQTISLKKPVSMFLELRWRKSGN